MMRPILPASLALSFLENSRRHWVGRAVPPWGGGRWKHALAAAPPVTGAGGGRRGWLAGAAEVLSLPGSMAAGGVRLRVERGLVGRGGRASRGGVAWRRCRLGGRSKAAPVAACCARCLLPPLALLPPLVDCEAVLSMTAAAAASSRSAAGITGRGALE